MQATPRHDPDRLLDRLDVLVAALVPPGAPRRTLSELLAILSVAELTTAAVNLGLLAEPGVPWTGPLGVAEQELVRLAPSIRSLALKGGFSTLKELAQRLHDATGEAHRLDPTQSASPGAFAPTAPVSFARPTCTTSLSSLPDGLDTEEGP